MSKNQVSPRKALYGLGMALLVGCVFFAPTPAISSSPTTASEALEALQEGNQRFVNDERTMPHLSAERIAETADGQSPFATIVTCADSRVPPEHLFDQGIGDLFVTRVAGNVCDTDTLGTLEYGVKHLGTPLLVVMGHSSCGAVHAVVENAAVGGNIPALVDNIVPAVQRVREKHPELSGEELLAAAVQENVWRGIEDVFHSSPTTLELAKSGDLLVVGAVYDLATGKVEFLGEHPEQEKWLEE